jgi:hypothetical protein
MATIKRLDPPTAKAAALKVLAAGGTLAEAAKAATRHVSTLNIWLAQDPEFAEYSETPQEAPAPTKQKLGVNKKTREAGIDPDADLDTKIIELVSAGWLLNDVATTLGIAESTVINVYHKPAVLKAIKLRTAFLYEESRRSLKASVPLAIDALRKAAQGKGNITTAGIQAAKEILTFNSIAAEGFYFQEQEELASQDDVIELLRTLPKSFLKKALEDRDE